MDVVDAVDEVDEVDVVDEVDEVDVVDWWTLWTVIHPTTSHQLRLLRRSSRVCNPRHCPKLRSNFTQASQLKTTLLFDHRVFTRDFTFTKRSPLQTGKIISIKTRNQPLDDFKALRFPVERATGFENTRNARSRVQFNERTPINK